MMWILLGLVINYFIGVVVCCAIDQHFFGDEARLLNWVYSAPWFIPAFIIVPLLWPVILYFAWHYNRAGGP